MRSKHFIMTIIFMVCVLFSSCKTTEYVPVPVETIKTEYRVKKDSVFLHDSINIVKEIKGDTVYLLKEKFKIKNSVRTDTVIKRDSIPVITTVEKVVEVNKLYSWQKALMCLGGMGVILGLGFILNKFKIWKLLF